MQAARFLDLVDLSQIQRLVDANSRIMGMPFGIVDAVTDQALAGAGWQELCTRFHHLNSDAHKRCLEIHAALKKQVQAGRTHGTLCLMGMHEIMIPILADGQHLASFLLGQFFIEGEMPTRDFFIRQAETFGFSLPDYLAALDGVPCFSRERVDQILAFFVSLSELVADMASKNLRLDRELAERRRVETILRENEGKLADSEIRLRTLLDEAPYGVFEYDLQPDGRLVLCNANRAADFVIKIDCQPLIGKTLEQAFPKLSETEIPEAFRNVLRTGTPYELAYFRYEDKDVEGVYEVRAVPSGRSRVAVFFRDVTDRKSQQDALEQRLEVLSGPLDNLSDLSFEDLFDIEEVQKIQDAFSEATGVASIITDIEGRPLTRPSQFCHLCIGIIRQTEKGLANCIHSDAVLGRTNPDGPTMQPCLSGGLWDGGTSICVGDRHIANWLIGQVLDDESDTEAMMGYARTIDADEEEFRKALKGVTRMSRQQFEKVCHALFLIAKQLSRLALKNVQQAREITRRMCAEDERNKLGMQIQHAQKLESLGVLAGGIAHDFNNLLMAILGHADLALQDLSPVSPVCENLHEIERASRRAAGLCQQMLAYSGKGKFVIQAVNLGEAIEEMSHMLEVSISKKVVLRYHFSLNLPPIEADVSQLRQIIMNLIVNASEAIGDKSGVVAISTGAMECDRAYLSETWLDEKLSPGLYVYLEVADTGSGMNKETLAKIFDPFFTTKFTGRGLGLAAVLGIVRGHRGAIKVYSEPGRGTTFKILFPASRRQAMRMLGEKPGHVRWQGSGLVLLVDDEETIRALGKQMLGRFGFTVQLAADGREALEIFRQDPGRFTLVLLDLTMPHMDGEQAFREMRRIKPDVRVIISSGYNEQEVSQRFVGKGLAGFIQKPYQLSSLEGVLKSVLGKGAEMK